MMLQLDLLIGDSIVDARGDKLGAVGEIVLRRHGEAVEVEGLIIGIEGWAERMNAIGALRALRSLVQRPDNGSERAFVRWEQIARLGSGRIDLNVTRDQLATLREVLPGIE